MKRVFQISILEYMSYGPVITNKSWGLDPSPVDIKSGFLVLRKMIVFGFAEKA